MSLTFNISLSVSHVSAICVDLIEHCQVGKMTENITIVGGFWGCLVLMGIGPDDNFATRKRHIYYSSEATDICLGFESFTEQCSVIDSFFFGVKIDHF